MTTPYYIYIPAPRYSPRPMGACPEPGCRGTLIYSGEVGNSVHSCCDTCDREVKDEKDDDGR